MSVNSTNSAVKTIQSAARPSRVGVAVMVGRVHLSLLAINSLNLDAVALVVIVTALEHQQTLDGIR